MRYGDHVEEASTTSGTGSLTLAGATGPRQTFADGLALEENGTARVSYAIENSTDFENGVGTVANTSPATLSRDQVTASSNGGGLVDWGSEEKTVGLVWGARDATIARDTATLAMETAWAVTVNQDISQGPWSSSVHIDHFVDESGINTTASSNQTFDAANTTYRPTGGGSNTTVSNGTSTWTGNTGQFAFNGDDAQANNANVFIRTSANVTNTMNFTFTATGLGGVAVFGLIDEAEVANFSQSSANAAMETVANSYWYSQAAGNVMYGSTIVASNVTINNGEEVLFQRSAAGEVSLSVNSTPVHTFGNTTSAPFFLVIGRNGGSNADYDDISWTDDITVAGNMTLVSETGTVTTSGDVTDGVLHILADADAAGNISVGLTGDISGGSGSNFATATITNVGAFGDGQVHLIAEADLSDVNITGTDPGFRIETSEGINIDAIGLGRLAA